MDIRGRVAVVTGGGGGIGGALARALAVGGARVLVADLNASSASTVADDICSEHPAAAMAVQADASDEEQLRRVLATAEAGLAGPVDLFFANAGIAGAAGLPDEPAWAEALTINLLAHVRAARLLVPDWIDRGGGYFVSTASAAGLLTQIGLAPYTVSKHAAVAFAEWLAITYGAQGIRVSCLCPMGVDTAMLRSGLDTSDRRDVGARAVMAAGDVLSPSKVAQCVLESIAEERFLILPHPEVLDFYRRKASNYDRWLAGMRRLQMRVERD